MKSFAMLFSALFLVAGLAHADVDLAEFDHLDPKGIVPTKPLKQALTYYKNNQSKFDNKNYIIVIDYTQHSSKRRMYIINMETGIVEPRLTSHGRGSDSGGSKGASGWATKFSNQEGSNATSLGFFSTAETYTGKHGLSLKLDGLSPTNSNARDRAVVIHGASYVNEKTGHAGRSQGCPALDNSIAKTVINKIKGGAMIYAYYEKK